MPSAINLPLLPYQCFPADGGDGPEPADLGSSRQPQACVSAMR
jgi:hypothetical protein